MTQTCPLCDGEKLIEYGEMGEHGQLSFAKEDCWLCHGAGEVTTEQAERYAARTAEIEREDRKAKRCLK